MKYRFVTVLMIAGFAGFARAQAPAPPVDSDAMAQTDSSDDGPSTEPAADDAQTPPAQTSGAFPTTQAMRSTTRPYHRHYRRPISRTNSPASLVSATPQPRQISADYSVVMNRSIFLKGNQITSQSDRGYTVPSGSLSAPEHSLVFNGVTRGDTAMAMVENIETHEIMNLRVGDAISHGKVVGITLNNLDYEVGGQITRVGFGETLSGGAPEGENQSAIPSEAGTTQPSNQPAARQLGESIEAYMRRRHAMGL